MPWSRGRTWKKEIAREKRISTILRGVCQIRR
jgi:hypothetical protein